MNSHPIPLDKFAIYYGWPIAVNGVWSVAGAIKVFNMYDIIVFGSGFEEPEHQEYHSTRDIISGVKTEIFGRVDSTLDTIRKNVDQWAVMGVAGIFCDKFGFDFGLDRHQQNDIVDYVHSKNLLVLVNAWDPDDVFKKSHGIEHHLSAGDWYLAESHYISNGDWQAVSVWEAKSDKMRNYRASAGVNMACITTTTPSIGFVQDKWDNAYYAHSVYSFDASGWGEPYFSAGDAQLPFRNRASIPGSKTDGSLTKVGGIFEQQTNVGIHLNTNNHTFSKLLD